MNKKRIRSPVSQAMSELGRIGGNANIKKHGKSRMRKIIKDRWKKEKESKSK